MSKQKTYGQIAYEAYCASTDWKSAVTGAPLPQFENTSQEIQKAWGAAALAVCRAAGNISLTKDGDKFCAFIGDDLATGINGFGPSQASALQALAYEVAKTETSPVNDGCPMAINECEAPAGCDCRDGAFTPGLGQAKALPVDCAGLACKTDPEACSGECVGCDK